MNVHFERGKAASMEATEAYFFAQKSCSTHVQFLLCEGKTMESRLYAAKSFAAELKICESNLILVRKSEHLWFP